MRGSRSVWRGVSDLEGVDAPSPIEAHKALIHRAGALAEETESGRLLALAIEGEYDVLRTAAVRRLSDSAALERVAAHATDREVLKIVLEKVEDKAVRNRIAATADDRPMRLAAAQKSGMKSWPEIFDAATAKGATEEMLGDAVAAVSLSSEWRMHAYPAVRGACLNLIRRGDESRIPELVNLLDRYGDTRLAEDYLNCGQPVLRNAATEWARARGYRIGTGQGSHGATWRRGR